MKDQGGMFPNSSFWVCILTEVIEQGFSFIFLAKFLAHRNDFQCLWLSTCSDIKRGK